jgi:hypothetical protein
MSYRKIKSKYLAKPPENSDKSGQKLVQAKYQLGFLNEETGEYHETTDLKIKKARKIKRFIQFKEKYIKPFTKKEISISLFVTDKEDWSKQSDFLSYLKKKFLRMNVLVLGYIWANDIGEEAFKDHTHTQIATSRLSSEQIKKLIKKKNKYKFVMNNNLPAFNKYLRKKELYAEFKKRSWGSSRIFKSLKNK